MKDALGDRMKSYYEDRTRFFLPRRTYTIIRIDGKAFHTYTKGLNKPFDDGLISDMDETAIYLAKSVQGCKLGFVQSDEISLLLEDFRELTTDAWFDGNIQKIVSVSASLATSRFNRLRILRCLTERDDLCDGKPLIPSKDAEFDARVFTIPSSIEVENYFIWRQQDCTRNSIQSVAQSLYSEKQLHGNNTDQLQELIFQKGINWNDYAPKYKRGRCIVKVSYEKGGGLRSKWISEEPPIFTQERDYLAKVI